MISATGRADYSGGCVGPNNAGVILEPIDARTVSVRVYDCRRRIGERRLAAATLRVPMAEAVALARQLLDLSAPLPNWDQPEPRSTAPWITGQFELDGEAFSFRYHDIHGDSGLPNAIAALVERIASDKRATIELEKPETLWSKIGPRLAVFGFIAAFVGFVAVLNLVLDHC